MSSYQFWSVFCERFCLGAVLSKEDKEVQRQRQLKQMKLKYGLKVSRPVMFCELRTFFFQKSKTKLPIL